MKTRLLRNFIRPCLQIAFILSLVALTQNAFAQGVTIQPGSPVAGDLSLRVLNSGEIQIAQHNGSGFVNQLTANTFENGSYLKTNIGDCSFGYGTPVGSPTSVSNSITGNTLSTIVDCQSGALSWQQDIDYLSGNYAKFTWIITNNSANPISASFFHAQHAGLQAATDGVGFIQTSIFKVGVRRLDISTTSVLHAISLQPLIPPDHFDSTSSTVVSSNIQTTGQLSDTIDPTTQPTTYALQWDNPSIPASATWVISGYVQVLNNNAANGVYMIAPAYAPVSGGTPNNIGFLLFNSTGSGTTVTFTSNVSNGSWTTAGFSGGSSQNLGPNSEQEISAILIPSSFASVGDKAGFDITADVSGQNTGIGQPIDAEVVFVAPTPTPTPTETPTPTVTPTATFTIVPTITPTATATSLPTLAPTILPTSTPTPKNVAVNIPFNSTGTLMPVINGSALPGSSITLFVDDVAVGTAVADVNGFWTLQVPSKLSIGTHKIQADAIDLLGRKSSSSAVNFLITGGAELDFEGDGFTDLSSYVNLGSSVIYRVKTSSNETSQVFSIPGVVPAAADYDGDGTTDIAGIGRSGKTFLWSVALSLSGQSVQQSFGLRGDTLLTGCRIASPNRASLAVLRKRNLIYTDLGSSNSEQTISDFLPASQTFLGCADLDGDNTDEIIVASGDSKQTISAIKLNKQITKLITTNNFSRSYIMRTPNNNQPLLLVVRSESPTRRSLQPLALTDSQTFDKVAVSRQLIVGSGLALDPEPASTTINSAFRGFFYQDLKTNKVKGFKLGAQQPAYLSAALARGSRVVLSQYAYPTR